MGRKVTKSTVALLGAMTTVLAVSAVVSVRSQEVRTIPAFKPATLPVTVAIAKGSNYHDVTTRAIDLAGDLEGIVKKGTTVLIKPNIVGPSPSGAGRITDWRVVQAVVDRVRELGAARVIVGEGPVEADAQFCFKVAGYDNIKNAELMNLSVPKSECYYTTPEKHLAKSPLWIPKIYLDADVVIDVSIMKTHYTAGVTMALKNVGIGIPSLQATGGNGWKEPLHQLGLNRTIIDVNQIRRPDFNIVDGMVAGEGNGPVSPIAKPMNIVLAGRDPVAVDTIGTTIMGYDTDLITHQTYAAGLGLGTGDMSKIKVVGEDYKSLISTFKKPPKPDPWAYMRTGVSRAIAGTVKIDGSITQDEWQGGWVNRLDREGQVRVNKGLWSGPKDASASLMISHDDSTIYIAADVRDDDFHPGKAGTIPDVKSPTTDGLELLFSFKHPFDESTDQRHSYQADKDYVLSVSAPVPGDEARLYSTAGKGDPTVVEGSVVRSRKTAEGYSLEIAIPITSLKLTSLTYGTEFYFDAGLVDVDGTDSFTRMTWTGGTTSYRDPATMGRMLVVDWNGR